MGLTVYKLSSTDPRSVELTLTCEPEKFELCQRIWDQGSSWALWDLTHYSSGRETVHVWLSRVAN